MTEKLVVAVWNGTSYQPIDHLASLITGTSTGGVTEAGGVDNGAGGEPTDTGDMYAEDLNGSDDAFQAVAAGATTANGYGTYELTAAGVWKYTLDNNVAAVDSLPAGETLTDSFTVSAADGATKVVTITITGTNDVPVITNVAAEAQGTVIEAGHDDDGTALAHGPALEQEKTAARDTSVDPYAIEQLEALGRERRSASALQQFASPSPMANPSGSPARMPAPMSIWNARTAT